MADKNLNASLKIWIDGKEIPNTVNAISKEMRKLQREQKDMTIGSQEYVEQTKKIAELNTILSEHKNQLKAVGKETNSLTSSLKEVVKFGVGGALGNAFTGLKDKIMAAAQESVELAKQAEGIEIAFNRLDKPGLLEKLRQETHGAVSDLTLMTQAVKFKDFNLPIEQLGTYLAYAQQKAKDTGQDLGYLVDSIVTGLGRQSLPILDNLGLSATEIRAEMAKGGDMFTAVANIIKKNMAEAGEYVETASDRAAQAAARLENAQVQLGKELLPIKENADAAFSQIQIGAIEAIRWIVKHRETLYTLVTAIAAVTAVYQLHNVWQKTVAAWNTILATGNKAIAVSMGVLRGAGIALQAMWALLTGGVKAYTVVMRAAAIASAAHPFLALVSVLAAVASGVYMLSKAFGSENEELKKVNEAAQQQAQHLRDIRDIREKANSQTAEEIAKINALRATVENVNESYSKRKTALEELKRIVPEYHGNLTREHGLINSNTSALDAYVKNLQKAAMAQAAMNKITSITEHSLNTGLTRQQRQMNQQYALGQLASHGFDPATMTLGGNINGNYIRQGGTFIRKISGEEADEINRWIKVVEYNKQRLSDLNASLQKDQAAIDNVNRYMKGMGIDLNNPPKSPVQADGGYATPAKTGRTGKVNNNTVDPEKELREKEKKERERIQKEMSDIDLKYLKQRNELTKKYIAGDYDSRKDYEEDLLATERQKLEEQMDIAGLEPEKRERIFEQILKMRAEYEDKMNGIIKTADEKRLEDSKKASEKLKETQDELVQQTDAIMKEASFKFGEFLGNLFQGEKIELKNILKESLLLIVEYLEKKMRAVIISKTMEAAIAGTMTFGAAAAKAAAEVALMETAFAAAKGFINSFESGGFTGPGAWNEEKGVVHANEFVANRHATANPSVMPVLSLIDAAQKSGSVANLTSADIASVLPTTSMVTPEGSNRSQQGNRELLGMLAAANKTNQMLLARLKQPLVAETYASGRRGVNEAQDLLERMKSNVRRG